MDKQLRHRRGRWLAWLGGSVALMVVAAVVAAVLITRGEPFGAAPAGERLARAQQSPQWQHGKFDNPQPMWADSGAAWRAFLFDPAIPGSAPDAPIPVVRNAPDAYARPPADGLRLTWFGHSSVLLELDGTTVLIDPLWSERASPLSWIGPSRWYPPPMALNDLPKVDVVLISHDHVDHLDYQTIVAMRAWRNVFVVPLGIGAHLARWGIPESRIVELDWWQSTRVGAVELAATPARHASGRLQSKSNQTLWAGWAVLGPRHRAWYSGDTGFHQDLAAIGERYGPFDLTLIEAGQYDAHWPDTHLGPEQAVEAHQRVRGKVMVPVHWALIQQAPHAWTEPVERVMAAARCRGVPVLAPRPGEMVESFDVSGRQPWWPRQSWRTAGQYPVRATQDGDPAHRVSIAACPAPASGAQAAMLRSAM